GVTIDETIPFDPRSDGGGYDRSKAEATLEVMKGIEQGLDGLIVCPTGVIGPFDFRRSEMGRLILDCMEKKVQLTVDGAYDFVDVRDVANGLVLARDKGRSGEAYILSGEQIQLPLLMRMVQDITGIRSVLLKIPSGLAKMAAGISPIYYRMTRQKPLFTRYSIETVLSNSVISSRKARLELGYTARSIRESVGDSVSWFKLDHLLTGLNRFTHRSPSL
ncbi:MAG: NAD-dependent epimerase/dehydratase family protein, partial [Chloroflexota bacterium]